MTAPRTLREQIEALPCRRASLPEGTAFVRLANVLAILDAHAAPRQARGGVYMASKTAHAGRWRDLRKQGFPVACTWIDEAGAGETADFPDLWARCIREAATAAALILYCEPGEILKGALVEVGAALAAGVPVLWVGPAGSHTVTQHAGVRWCDMLDAALAAARAIEADRKSRSLPLPESPPGVLGEESPEPTPEEDGPPRMPCEVFRCVVDGQWCAVGDDGERVGVGSWWGPDGWRDAPGLAATVLAAWGRDGADRARRGGP